MSVNLGLTLGQQCAPAQSFDPTRFNPAQQIGMAEALPVGEGWLTTRGQIIDRFAVICLRGVLVIAPRDSTRILKKLEPIVGVMPWARETSSGSRSWCGPSYACTPVAAPSSSCGSFNWTQVYPDWRQQGVCLPTYDYTQRVEGRAQSFCWNNANASWAQFWQIMSEAVRRHNLT